MRTRASIEDIDFTVYRDLDRSLILALADGGYLRSHRNILICGPTGVGKTYMACALGYKACLQGYSVRYFRSTTFSQETSAARVMEKFGRFQTALAKTDLLIIDDFGLQELKTQERLDLLDFLDDRTQRKSTIFATQLPVANWHEVIGDNTIADAIMDRFIHSAYQIHLKGESMRKKRRV